MWRPRRSKTPGSELEKKACPYRKDRAHAKGQKRCFLLVFNIKLLPWSMNGIMIYIFPTFTFVCKTQLIANLNKLKLALFVVTQFFFVYFFSCMFHLNKAVRNSCNCPPWRSRPLKKLSDSSKWTQLPVFEEWRKLWWSDLPQKEKKNEEGNLLSKRHLAPKSREFKS